MQQGRFLLKNYQCLLIAGCFTGDSEDLLLQSPSNDILIYSPNAMSLTSVYISLANHEKTTVQFNIPRSLEKNTLISKILTWHLHMTQT